MLTDRQREGRKQTSARYSEDTARRSNGDEVVSVKERREKREERREETGGGYRGDDMAANGLTDGGWAVSRVSERESEKLRCLLCRTLATWRPHGDKSHGHDASMMRTMPGQAVYRLVGRGSWLADGPK